MRVDLAFSGVSDGESHPVRIISVSHHTTSRQRDDFFRTKALRTGEIAEGF
jgi:hypothetical protein